MNIFGGGANDDELDNIYNRGVFDMAKESYHELLSGVIRPPRRQYSAGDLGPANFNFQGQEYHRVDFAVTNVHSHMLQCSFWGAQRVIHQLGEMPPPGLAPATEVSVEIPTGALRFE
jgi:hypothetical protein